MKALVYTAPETMEYRDFDDPVVTRDDNLIQVETVGICGSDMHAWHGHDARRPTPLILGHEAAGVVVEGPWQGKRVTVNPLVTCMECTYCKSGRSNLCPGREIISMPPRQGAFAQFVSIPARNLVEIPDEFDFVSASLAEPIACSWHAVRLGAQVLHEQLSKATTVVLGGGAIGLAAALVLHEFGCTDIWIAETNTLRHTPLAKAGPFKIYNPQDGGGPPDGSVHLTVDAFGGEPTRAAACALARRGGVIVHIGLAGGQAGLNVRRMTLQEITFIGTYTYTMDDFRDTANAIFEGRLGALDWVEIRALKDGAGAFEDISAGRAASPKIILKP